MKMTRSKILTHLCLVFTAWGMSTPLPAAVPGTSAETAGNPASSYGALVIQDGASAYWRFSGPTLEQVINEAPVPGIDLTATSHAHSAQSIDGPVPSEFPLFEQHNSALDLRSPGQYFRVADPGTESPLDFDQGQSLTLEAWVKPDAIPNGAYTYVLGKGRTQAGSSNQNYALRLTGADNGVKISFLFRSRGKSGNWHRWTSNDSFPVGDGWHHVVISYTFGQSKSIKGYIDGNSTAGKWDMGGASNNPPVIDNDDLWIGTSLGGSTSNSYRGGIDEVAVYRTPLSAEQIETHYKYVPPKFTIDPNRIPESGVLVDLYENLPDRKSWSFRPPQHTDSYMTDSFGFVALPIKYSDKAIQIDRSNPCLLRAVGRVTLPAGEHRLLVRSRNSARLYLDDELLVETPFHNLGGDSGPIIPIDLSLAPHIRPLHRGDQEKVVSIQGDGRSHVVVFETLIGGQKRRPELGETGAFLATPAGDFRLLGSQEEVLLTTEGWDNFISQQEEVLDEMNFQRRHEAGKKEREYWQRRHDWAREVVGAEPAPAVPDVGAAYQGKNWIDRFIGARLEAAKLKPASLTNDAEFLRRVTLDITGRTPTAEEIRRFEQDPAPERRQLVIDRLLASREWADNWVGYWQDVLAENPNIINPTLNNTGPFRFWIEESFRDNKPFDRFVTELTMMEGSTYYGGPGGFAMSSQNDAPMAAKAHVLGEAFLASEMKCARCHDAPFHDFLQRDLFSLGAMLNRKSLKLPATSTVPGGSNSVLIAITLFPGDVIEPVWPFEELSPEEPVASMLRDPNDTREKLALLLTSPYNERFTSVIVNRLWQRYLGYGLVESVDDWEHAEPSHPKLLQALCRELVTHDYDLKHLARLIFQSEVYQRQAVERSAAQSGTPYLFAAPLQRRMSAEQVVDSLFTVCGKPFDADVMCIDIDTSRAYSLSLNLGAPRRAWQFASMSNERDRPSLSLPFAQPFLTTLETFGWRSSRQDPLTIRETDPSPLQSAELSNGLLARRICSLSDDSALTALALQDQPLPAYIDAVYERILTRKPTDSERDLFAQLLKDGYEQRIVPGAKPQPRKHSPRTLVGWTNHLNPEASTIKLNLEDEVRAGDPPTTMLTADWRERAEDMIWALMNSPEFIFLP